MTRLVQFALEHLRAADEFRVIDAAAGDGRGLVALADAIAAEERYGELSRHERVEAVARRLRGADVEDRGARAALAEWAGEGEDVASTIVGFGEPLAFDQDPVQGDLFSETAVLRPPPSFRDGPFDLVVARVGRRAVDDAHRVLIRGRFDSVSGVFSTEVPFIERLFDLVKADGLIAIRVRAAILRREFGRALVASLRERATVLGVERDGDDVLACLRPGGERESASLLQALGSRAAARAMARLDVGAQGELEELLASQIGATSVLGTAEVWEVPRWLQQRVPHVSLVRGGDIGSWTIRASQHVVWPYDDYGASLEPPPRAVVEWLARFRRVLEARRSFGKTPNELGRRWYEYLEHHPDRWAARPVVLMARSGTESRVAISRKRVVAGGGAYAIHPTDPDDVLLIAGLLGSSVGTFWLKQTFFVYETERGLAFEATARGLRRFPLPSGDLGPIRTAAANLDRIGRSVQPLRGVIDGDPERLAERIEAHLTAHQRIAEELIRARGELDQAVSRAFGLDPGWAEDLDDEPGAAGLANIGAEDIEAELSSWLMDFIHDGFERGELPAGRPVGVDEIQDWLRIEPLARAVLRRLGISATSLLLAGSVPLEPAFVFSASGLEKLKLWASGRPEPLQAQDYASVPTRVPSVSAGAHRRRIWDWRGRYNVPRERFLHLVELSETLGRPFFAWAGASDEQRRLLEEKVSTEPDAQLDLERLVQLRSMIAERERVDIGELADELFLSGWSFRDVELGLRVLERTGAVVPKRRFDD